MQNSLDLQADWIQKSSSPEAIEQNLRSNTESYSSDKQRSLIPFFRSISIIGYSRYNPESLKSLNCYKWEIRFTCDSHESLRRHISNTITEITCHNSNNALPNGLKFVLLLKDNDGHWHDWVFVAQSIIPNAGNGLFAARDFPPDSVIGYYCGKIIHETNSFKIQKRIDVTIEKNVSDKKIWIRKNDFCWVIIDAPSINLQSFEDIFMGMQFMNSEKLPRQTNSTMNVDISQAGCVSTISHVTANDELIWSYRL